jgi:hypothetical protein
LEKPCIDAKREKHSRYYANVFVRDVWDCDCVYTKPLISGSKEYLRFRIQKPEGLLKILISL